jgi:hypothetical protein
MELSRTPKQLCKFLIKTIEFKFKDELNSAVHLVNIHIYFFDEILQNRNNKRSLFFPLCFFVNLI